MFLLSSGESLMRFAALEFYVTAVLNAYNTPLGHLFMVIEYLLEFVTTVLY